VSGIIEYLYIIESNFQNNIKEIRFSSMLVIEKLCRVVNLVKEIYHVEFGIVFREDGRNCWAVDERFNY
jgi:hypothetical protein